MGTLTLTYDDGEYGGGCELRLTFDSETAGAWRYSCNSGNQDQGDWRVSITDSAVGRELEFSEGESTTRSIPENTPAGINVGPPVSAAGGGGVTYAMSGPDASSFVIVPGTGQVRTREDVVYDYETNNRYAVTVSVADDSGGSDTIEVTILIEDLVPACKPLRNLRTNHDDQRLTVRWNPSPETDGRARPLGYETEIRRGESGPWTDRRTFLGRNISAMIYEGLDNGIGYQVRVRPINAEGDCGWSPPLWGIPTDVLTPRFPTDRFGTEPVGAPDRNWRFLTQERCRHTSNGVTLDADCRYENTGPDTSRIFLEFDDPSRGSCEITLAYSSLTAGSFIDECFDAGVNTEVPFDRSFRMPRSGPQTEDDPAPPPTEAEPQRAPRSEDEFNALVLGRDDLIPGLSFRCFACFRSGGGVDLGPGWATRFEYDSHGRPYREILGKYTYRNTGPSQGVLTFEGNDENTYVFTLDVEPSGNMRVTITDSEGEPSIWPGMSHLDLTLGAQPVLLPIPPSWSAAIAIETDAAPDDYAAFEDLLSSHNPEHRRAYDPDLIWETLFGADADGLNNATFSYQWMADDSDIAGATNSTYTLATADQGKTIKVRVSFTDDRNHPETRTSDATVAVAARPNSPARGAPSISGTVQVGATLTADTSDIDDQDGTGSSHTLTSSEQGQTVQVRVSFTDDADNEETLTSAATATVAARPNSPPTGLPTISGTAQVGEKLEADTSGIDDQDGMNTATFAYQWLAGGSDISGATGPSHTLTSSEQGQTIQVRVSFTDDRSNEETLTSAASAAVSAQPSEPLTASLENTPEAHDGSTAFTFELRFSEEVKLSYKTLRDHSFTVTGGTVTEAKRLEQGSNIGWRIMVRPDGDGQVTITLPATTDCDAEGAICTGDGRRLSKELVLTVSGPGQ